MMKFIASDVDAAKAKARRALGAKVVFIAMRDLPSGDVELTASDREPTPEPAERAPHAPQDTYAPAPAYAPAGVANGGPGHAPPAQNARPSDTYTGAGFAPEAREALDADMRARGAGGVRLNERLEQSFSVNALDQLKEKLSGSAEPVAASMDLSTPKAQALHDLFRSHGFGEQLVAALLDGARQGRVDDDYHRLETAFHATFAFAPLGFSAATPLMLVGPTGAGKTSSSAKLAKYAMERDGAAFMMTADVGRAGAVEQIQTYGESLGADYHIVETPQDVARTLQQHRPRSAVLLDTPGVSPFDHGDVAALRSFQEAAGAEPILVLPASGDPEEFREWAVAFAEFGVRRMIITKFDATKRVGAALSAAHTAQMALACFSETAFISEGLIDASPDYLARRFLASSPGKVG